jgi:hypothetical protein
MQYRTQAVSLNNGPRGVSIEWRHTSQPFSWSRLTKVAACRLMVSLSSQPQSGSMVLACSRFSRADVECGVTLPCYALPS